MNFRLLGRFRKITGLCRLPALVAGLLLGLGAPALAETVQLNFEAIIVEIFDPLGFAPPTWMEGDTIRGCYNYEWGAVDDDPDPEIGLYEWTTPPSGIVINHNGYEYRTDPDNVDVSLELTDSQSHDQYIFLSQRNLLEPLVLGVGARIIHIALIESTPTFSKRSPDST